MNSGPVRSLSERPAPRTDLEVVDVGDERVVWDPQANRVYRLDAVAALIWPFLDGSATIGELAADVADVWGTNALQAAAALSSMVDEMDKASLLLTDQSLPHSA